VKATTLFACLALLLGACGEPEDDRDAEVCDNGLDDDGDGDLDCLDSDCEGSCPEVCDDGIDNDGDGDLDCVDADCDGKCVEDCDDGRDNDGDGEADCLDSDCNGLCPEICDDGLDNDGNGAIDCADPACAGECPEDCLDGNDNDADGAVDCLDPDCTSTCDADGDGSFGLAYGGDDCRDDDATVSPGQPEICNGYDDDCDGAVDEADPGFDPESYITFFSDLDLDGFGDPFAPVEACVQPAGTVPNDLDCDDGAFAIKPTAPEVCDGVDNDCDGDADDFDADVDLTTGTLWYADADGDGLGDSLDTQRACIVPLGYVDIDGDCYPFDPTIGAEQDWYRDVDGDGFGAGDPTVYCVAPAGWSVLGTDCDDEDDDVSPDTTWYADVDGDGYGDPEVSLPQCLGPEDYIRDDQDCDDSNPDVTPDTLWYADGDDDGWGDPTDSVVACAPVDVRVLRPGDCDDVDPEVGGPTEWWVDGDGDGYGDGVPTVPLCGDQPEGRVAADLVDCVDDDASIHPEAIDICEDGIDQTCDGLDPLCVDPVLGSIALSDVSNFIVGADDGDIAGIAVSGAGDLNGDGLDDLLVGATGDLGGAGAVGVFYGPIYGRVDMADADALLMGASDNDKFGGEIAGLGDFDGDGFDDVLVGARQADGSVALGARDSGVAHVFRGPLVGPYVADRFDDSGDSYLAITGAARDDLLGEALAAAGDVDGDGLADLIIGAQSAASGDGRVWVSHGAPSGFFNVDDASDTMFEFNAETPLDEFGTSVASAGDTNGDGLDDLLVGARHSNITALEAGSAYLFETPHTDVISAADADARMHGMVGGDKAGVSVAGGGDVNGDGTPDLLVGAPFTAVGGTAYLVSGRSSGELDLADGLAVLDGESVGERAGYSLALTDLDLDGFADLVIGADKADISDVNAGVTYVVYGPVTGAFGLGAADAQILGVGGGDQAGESVSAVGDLDGDGYPDLGIGAWHADEGGEDAGAVYVLYGAAL
jgi:hypothetical protein